MILIFIGLVIVFIPIVLVIKDLDVPLKKSGPYYEIFIELERIRQEIGIKSQIQLWKRKSRFPLDGKATTNKVFLTKNLLELWATNPLIVKVMLAHELIHIKYYEYKNRLKDFCNPTVKANALILLVEIRAEIEASTAAKLSDSEIDFVQNYIQEINRNLPKEISYKSGYPDRKQIAYFSKKYKEFNDEVADEILEDFANVMNVKNKESFILKVKKKHNERYS